MSGESLARFAGCNCQHCGVSFIRLIEPVGAPAIPGYCSDAHRRKAAKARRARRCPTDCGRDLTKNGGVVCGPCWSAVSGMCLGKRRLQEWQARDVEDSRGTVAYWCRCCGWWHNGHPVRNGDQLVQDVGVILNAMTTAKGQLWVNDLIESWDPSVRSRQDWAKNRPRAKEGSNGDVPG